MSVEGQQLPLTETLERFRFAAISGPYLKAIDTPESWAPLFDHVVGRHLHDQRHRKAERLGGL
jgi:hypothetical protein